MFDGDDADGEVVVVVVVVEIEEGCNTNDGFVFSARESDESGTVGSAESAEKMVVAGSGSTRNAAARYAWKSLWKKSSCAASPSAPHDARGEIVTSGPKRRAMDAGRSARSMYCDSV